jgi:hypothetical protein
MSRTKKCIWSLIALLFIALVLNAYFSGFAFILIALRWVGVALLTTSVLCAFWALTGAFSKNVLKRVVILLVLVTFCCGIYAITHRHPSTIRMKEDVLYIKPISK